MQASSSASRPGSLVCPFCQTGALRRSSGDDSMRCESCDGLLFFVGDPSAKEELVKGGRPPEEQLVA